MAHSTWARRLRQRREAAGWTRAQLATLANVSEATIRNAERGRNKPSQAIKLRVEAVFACVREEPPATIPPAQIEDTSRPACQVWFAPDYDPIALHRAHQDQLNHPSSTTLDPALFLLDPVTAAEVCQIREMAGWRQDRFFESMPAFFISIILSDVARNRPVELLALGSGDVTDELDLLRSTLSFGTRVERVILLDQSHSLLSYRLRRLTHDLHLRSPRTTVFAVAGDPRNLAAYRSLFAPPDRLRIVTLLGCQFGQLAHPLAFVTHALAPLAPGDLLVLDAYTSDAPDLSQDMRHVFASHLRRHVAGLHDVSVTGDRQATLTFHDQTQRRFLIEPRTCYDGDQRARMMKKANWHLVYQSVDSGPRWVYLFSKGIRASPSIRSLLRLGVRVP